MAARRPRSHFIDGGIQPDPRDDLPIEEGDDGQGLGPWVPAEKHRRLAEYLYASRKAWASPKWSARVYMDPFCSFGRCRVRGETFTRDGGAVVAWRESQQSGAPFTHVMVGDLDPARADACRARLAALGAPVTAYAGPASDTIPRMVRAVPARALCMAYIDPYNLRWLTFDLFRQLATVRSDIAAHFSVMDASRNADLALDSNRARFDEVAPGWRDEAADSSKANLQLRLLEYWRQQVQGLGYTSSKVMPLVRNSGNGPLYRLAFFARHPLPLRIWGDVARDQDQSDLFA